jgi:streptogramin lyase
MRFALAVAVCGGLVLAGCGGSSTGTSGPAPVLPPVANAGGPYTGTAGAGVSFNGGGSKDPQGQALTYAWNFGDGCAVQSNGYSCATGATPSHTYSQATQIAGQSSTTYTVTLTVQNTGGFSGQSGTTAVIQNLPGLADATLTGSVATGSTPIVGAHMYLYAASVGPSGTGSNSLLSATQTGFSDPATGTAYVVSDGQGNFSMTGDYLCTSGQQLYIYALGGTAGTQSIANAGLMTVLGNCPTTGTTVVTKVNEVSTIAAAYALAGYATDAVHVSSSGTALAVTGIANAFANAANLVKPSTGVALTATPAGNGTVPQTQIDALANILSVCVNPGTVANPYSASNCSLLLGDARSNGTAGTQATDTATVAIYIAHNPGSSLNSDIYNLANASPYTPTLSRQPNDYTVAISYSGGGLSGPEGIAIDGSGNAWVTNDTVAGVTKLSSVGAVATGSPYTGGGLAVPYGIAIDGSGNAWIANNSSGSVTEIPATFPATGTVSSYTVCNLSGPRGIAIDGSNNVWIPDPVHNDVCELSSAGALVLPSPYTGGGLNGPQSIAIDGPTPGNAWVANYSGGSVTEFSSGGVVKSGSNGYTGGGLHDPNGIAIDKSGSAWVADLSPSNLSEISSTGSAVAWSNNSLSSPVSVAIDGSGNVWVANQAGNTVSEYSNGGTLVSGANGYGGATGTASGIAVDGSGDVWVGNFTGNSVTEYIGAGAPVVTPLAVAVKNNALGSRP